MGSFGNLGNSGLFHIAFMVSSVFRALPHIKSGKLRAIAALGRTRPIQLPGKD